MDYEKEFVEEFEELNKTLRGIKVELANIYLVLERLPLSMREIQE